MNLAARLESACKHYGTWILTTSATLGAGGTGILSREMDHLRVVGREEAVTVHEILGSELDAPDSLKECVEIFGTARRAYLDGDFERACAGFLRSLGLEPNLGQPGAKTNPSEIFAARCRSYMEHPPSRWDGVHVATEK